MILENFIDQFGPTFLDRVPGWMMLVIILVIIIWLAYDGTKRFRSVKYDYCNFCDTEHPLSALVKVSDGVGTRNLCSSSSCRVNAALKSFRFLER